jgi:hypothetical protein
MKRSNRKIWTLAIVTASMAAVLMLPGMTHAGVLNPAPVAKSGQTTSHAPGDDGDLRQGVDWPDPRFTDNLDGTVTDHLTGLVWLKDATRFSGRGWTPALNVCNNLAEDGGDLTDGSGAGDWRLPNNRELRRLIDFGNTDPALPEGHPFIVPVSGSYWTSTTATNNTGRAWRIEAGEMLNDPKNAANLVWPVRDAQAGDLGPAPVPRTGQTISYGTRDDGELQNGVEWPDPRFTDNLDGTVTDHLTGLIWLADSTLFSDLSFADALAACNALADDGTTLTDGSIAGAWRLPNVLELGSLNDFGEIGPALPAGHPFIAAAAGTFWTSTTSAANGNRAWTLGMGIGKLSDLAKGSVNQVWPVRGATPVPVDIKPGSCPNPLNVKSQGKLPVAVLGTVDFDVTTIDPLTIRLEGVAPIRSSLEDVATSFEPLTGKEDCDLDCTEEGPDGWLDLTLKFDTQEIVDALGDEIDSGCRVLTLTGHLKEEFGSTPIEGEDVVLILHGDGKDEDDDSRYRGASNRFGRPDRTRAGVPEAGGNSAIEKRR